MQIKAILQPLVPEPFAPHPASPHPRSVREISQFQWQQLAPGPVFPCPQSINFLLRRPFGHAIPHHLRLAFALWVQRLHGFFGTFIEKHHPVIVGCIPGPAPRIHHPTLMSHHRPHQSLLRLYAAVAGRPTASPLLLQSYSAGSLTMPARTECRVSHSEHHPILFPGEETVSDHS